MKCILIYGSIAVAIILGLMYLSSPSSAQESMVLNREGNYRAVFCISQSDVQELARTYSASKDQGVQLIQNLMADGRCVYAPIYGKIVKVLNEYDCQHCVLTKTLKVIEYLAGNGMTLWSFINNEVVDADAL